MQKKIPALIAFVILCLIAFGGGNVLRQSFSPDENKPKNEFFEAIGRVVKGLLRDGETVTSADAQNLNLVEYGSQVYNAQCAECHGNKLQGQENWKVRNSDGVLPAPPHDASGHSWHHSDQLLFDYTRNGGQVLMPEGVKSGMPAFGDVLNDRDIWAVLAFIKSQWPEDVQTRQASMNGK